MTIQKEANAAAAAVGTPVNSKWDILNRLRSFDFNRVVGGLQLMKQIRESFLASEACIAEQRQALKLFPEWLEIGKKTKNAQLGLRLILCGLKTGGGTANVYL